MAYLNSIRGIDQINIRINSGGGSVLDGYSILTAILNSKVKCDTYIDGLAASMAATIAVCGNKVYMSDYGTFMIHNAQGEDQKVAALFSETINTILTKRTGNDAESIAKMMDKETWMDAKTCKKMGFVDEIINTSKKVTKIKASATLEERFAIYNNVLNQEKINMKEIAKSLGLAESATEAEIINAINKLNADKTEVQNKLTEIENAKKEAEKLQAEARKAKATAVANKLVNEKKMKPEEVANFVELASATDKSLETMTNMVATIVDPTKSVAIFNPQNASQATGREGWDFQKWSKEDPKGLMEMQNNRPEEFKALYEKTYKKK